MKIQTLMISGLLSTTALAADYMNPSYRVGQGQLLGSSTAVISNQQQSTRDSRTNLVNRNENGVQRLNQNIQYGLSKNLAAVANFSYATNETLNVDNSELKSQGLERIEIGANYRLNSHLKLPLYLDVGVIAKVATEDKRIATAKDEGTAGTGGHELILTSRASRNRYFADAIIAYHLPTTQVNASTGLEQAQTSARTDIMLAAGKQFVPTKSFLLNASAKLARMGENTTELEGGSITVESHLRYGINLMGTYAFSQNLSASMGAEYLLSTDHTITSYRDQSVENETTTALSLGVNYIF